MTEAMEERVKTINAHWKDEGNGYFSGVANSPSMGFTLAYIALPENHPDVGEFYDNLMTEETDWGPKVNGGLTFSNGNVFGWDYGHAYNTGNFFDDVRNALEWFRAREVAQK